MSFPFVASTRQCEGMHVLLSMSRVVAELAAFDPVHVAFTGNPAHLNFGKGLGKVGFYSGT